MSITFSVSAVVPRRCGGDPTESPTAMVFLGWGDTAAGSAPSVCVVRRVEVMRPIAGIHGRGVGGDGLSATICWDERGCIDQTVGAGRFSFFFLLICSQPRRPRIESPIIWTICQLLRL